MQFLLETLLGIAFFALIIWALPTIIGILSLGIIVYFALSMVTNVFGDSAGKEQDEAKSRPETKHELKAKTTERTPRYSNTGYSGYRHYEDDDYESRYSSYYDDRDNDDMPPDDEIHFRGTGGPFL